jgi:hypothetical protein
MPVPLFVLKVSIKLIYVPCPTRSPTDGVVPEDMSLTLTQSRMSGLESLTGSGLAREAQAVAANFQIQVEFYLFLAYRYWHIL